jgi:S-DNA-T family DNA segregation ATPase FtsK/SpoIIIE
MGKTNNKKSRLGAFFADERLRIILGSFIILFSLYLYLTFISYLFTWKIDQSFDFSKVFSGPDTTVDNWGGKMGAYLSNLFMNKWFGLASFFLPFILLIAGSRLLGIKLLSPGRTTLFCLAATILLSVILAFVTDNLNGYLGSGPGGAHGYFLSNWLTALLGTTGTAFFLLLLVLVFLIFSFRNFISWIKVIIVSAANRKKPETDLQEEPAEETSKEEDVVIPETPVVEDITDPRDEDLQFTTRTLTPEEIEEKDQVPIVGNGVEMTVEKRQQVENGSEIIDEQVLEDYDPTLELSHYKLPPLDLLSDHQSGNTEVSEEELISNKNRIVETLGNYNIQIDKIKATIGPTVTLYEIVPAPGIRISKIKNLEDDIALSLSALGIRIIAPIPGRGTIGIEVPNRNPEIVSMKSIISSRKFQESKFDLPIGLGKTISNETYVVDLTKMPHLLVAGATGQGKSVGLNAIITSLLYRKHPAQIKFVFIDPKKVELTLYGKLEKHFLAMLPDSEEPIITDTQQVIRTLNSLTIEMDSRYNLLKSAQVRNIKEYNEKFIARKLNPLKGHRYMPYIIVIVDEFADLIMTAGREIEMPLARLAQLARAIGIHLVIATQRPSINIITGAIKANFPARLAFKVTSMMDSRTILDSPGANQLVGRGDMLITSGSDLIRLQCAYIDTPEIESITSYIASQQSYTSAHLLPDYSEEPREEAEFFDPNTRDDLFEKAARLVVEFQQGSTSLIQRKFSIGYNRAGRIVDQLEAAGILGPYEGSKARQVMMKDLLSLEQFLEKNTQDQ